MVLIYHSDRDQAFGVHRCQPDGQRQAGDEVEYFEEDPSLAIHGSFSFVHSD